MFASRLSYYPSCTSVLHTLRPLGMRVSSVAPFLHFVLTGLSLRLFGSQYVIKGGLLNISANRSFD